MMAATPAFLGVETSARGRRWIGRLDREAMARAEALVQIEGVPDVLARVLAARGVEADQLSRHLEPKLRDWLPDPATVTDMEPLVARLVAAVRARRPVAIFGDYDVDGACSAALLSEGLERLGVPTCIYIPDRLTEGYGPNSEAIRMLAGQGAALLVTVDCGTTSHEPVAEARRLGLDVLVIDHHQAPVELPEAVAIVNPNRQDDLSGLGHLCAAGVVFVVLVALHRALRREGFWAGGGHEPDLMMELDLVALATVADVVPLVGLNRAFVRQGLLVIRERLRPGLAALTDAAGLTGPVAPWHLGFALGPRINAGGRIGDASLGARLLTCRDEIEARRMAAELDALNRARQDIERLAVEEGLAQADAALAASPDLPVLAVASAEWHPGVLGLVAARLKERFSRPAFALALDGAGGGVGSGRSIGGVDLGRAVRAAAERGLIVKGGGHAMAAGVTLGAGGLPRFAEAMAEALGAEVAASQEGRQLAIDSTLSAAGATPALVAQLEKAGPFGQGAPEPVFAFADHRLVDAAVVGAGGHLRVRLRAGDGSMLSGIAFRAANEPLGRFLLAARGETAHVAGSLTVDRWGGGERTELRICDAAAPTGG